MQELPEICQNTLMKCLWKIRAAPVLILIFHSVFSLVSFNFICLFINLFETMSMENLSETPNYVHTALHPCVQKLLRNQNFTEWCEREKS